MQAVTVSSAVPVTCKGEDKKLYVPPQARGHTSETPQTHPAAPKQDKKATPTPSSSSDTKATATREQGRSERQTSKVASSRRVASSHKSAAPPPKDGTQEKPLPSHKHSRPRPHDNRLHNRRDNKPHPPREGRGHSSSRENKEASRPLDPPAKS